MNINQNLKTYISKGNARLFIALLLITSGIWFIIQLSKTYKADLSVNIKFTDIPINQVIDNKKISVNYELKATGFKLIWHDFKSNIIDYSLNKLNQSEQSYLLNTDLIKDSLKNKYFIKEENIKFNKDTIKINFSEKEVKYVKIKPLVSYSFASGYNTIHQLKTNPDSIKVSGKKNILNQIKYIKTKKIKITDVNDTINQLINLRTPKEEIDVKEEQVKIYLPVQKFTEVKKVVSVQITNVPDSIQVNYFPKNVSLNYLVPISKYNDISTEQFKVECDFKDKYSKQGIIIPKVTKKPDYIKNINISPSKIDFFIKK